MRAREADEPVERVPDVGEGVREEMDGQPLSLSALSIRYDGQGGFGTMSARAVTIGEARGRAWRTNAVLGPVVVLGR